MSPFIAVLLILSFCRLTLGNSNNGVGVGYAFSTYAVQKLVLHEQKILALLNKYLEQAQTQLQNIKAYTKKGGFVGNPNFEENMQVNGKVNDNRNALKAKGASQIEVFQLFQRIRNDLNPLFEGLGETINHHLISNLKSLQSRIDYPKEQDVLDSQMGIIRLQQIFNISAKNLKGSCWDLLTKTNSGLTAEDLYYLGNYSYRKALYTLALPHFDACLSRLRKLAKRDLEFEKEVKEKMKKVAERHDFHLANGTFSRQKNPFHFSRRLGSIKSKSYRNKRSISTDEFLTQMNPDGQGKLSIMFNQICQKGDLREPTEKKDLYCEYSSSNNPYLYLQPYKLEWLNLDPKIVQIYDFLNNGEANTLRQNSDPFLERSSVELENSRGKPHAGRTSSSLFYRDHVPGNPFGYISKRIEILTGLNVQGVQAAEEMQVANYNPGTFYGPHYDAIASGTGTLEKLSKERIADFLGGQGDRISTFMIYLSNVEVGGATAFPELNFAAQPIKGSAVFWDNLLHDGSLDIKSLHGGCPVVYGSKYIANKWIRSDGQMFVRKCSTAKPDRQEAKFIFQK